MLDSIFNDWLLNKFRANLHRMAQENTTAAIIGDLEALARRQPRERHMRHSATGGPAA